MQGDAVQATIQAVVTYLQQEFPDAAVQHAPDDEEGRHRFTILLAAGARRHAVLISSQFLAAARTAEAIKQFLDIHGCAEKLQASGDRPILVDEQGAHFTKRR